jgi:hypothetical protein
MKNYGLVPDREVDEHGRASDSEQGRDRVHAAVQPAGELEPTAAARLVCFPARRSVLRVAVTKSAGLTSAIGFEDVGVQRRLLWLQAVECDFLAAKRRRRGMLWRDASLR